MADYRKHYGATSAPLVVNDLVISERPAATREPRLRGGTARPGEEVWPSGGAATGRAGGQDVVGRA